MNDTKKIYLFSHGNLRIRGDILYLENEDVVEKFSVDGIDEIYILGEVKIGGEFLRIASRKKMTIHFFNYYGYYSGTFFPGEHYSTSELLLKQTECYLNNYERLKIARLFVEGAICNILQVIKYYKNRGRELNEVEEGIAALAELTIECGSINELMAIEGNVRNYYYQGFDKILDNPDFKFEQRSKRPPKNFLNTLISFGNSMLYTAVLSQIYYTHLDSRIGYLHTSNFRRFSLNLDIAEIFKPIIVDRVIFTVINRNIITANDFEYFSKGIMLKEKGKETFVNNFEDKMNSIISLTDIEGRISYRNLIQREAENLEEYFLYGVEYKPFVARW